MVAAARYYHARDYAEAERCCLELIASDARHFDALHLLGVVCLDRAQYPDAVGYLTRAVRERANDPKVHYHLGTALLGLKLYQQEGIPLSSGEDQCRTVGVPGVAERHSACWQLGRLDAVTARVAVAALPPGCPAQL